MNKETVISSVTIQLPYDRILSRLGYNRYKTDIGPKQRRSIDMHIHSAFSFCENMSIWNIYPVEVTENTTVVNKEIHIESQSLASYIDSSSHIILMFATAGKYISEKYRDAVTHDENGKAAIYDAVGSETADAVCNWTHMYLKKTLQRTYGVVDTKRFSPGYGDLSLQYQKVFYELLSLERYGISINDRYFLQPEKSVTAFCKVG